MTNSKRAARSRGPELLLDLAQKISSLMEEMLEMDKASADHVGQTLANLMAAHWGGQLIYFPMGTSLQISNRDQEIWANFNGSNHSELVTKYGISLQWIYKIIKAQRAADLASRQGSLFTEQ